MTPLQINRKRIYIEGKVSYWEQKICELQEICQHPNVLKKHRGDTGNWDRGSDKYWIEFECPDCGKFWTEDQ